MPYLFHRTGKDVLEGNPYRAWKAAEPGSPWYIVPDNQSWRLRQDYFQVFIGGPEVFEKSAPPDWLVQMKDGTFRLGWGNPEHPKLARPLIRSAGQGEVQNLLGSLDHFLDDQIWPPFGRPFFVDGPANLFGSHVVAGDSLKLQYYQRFGRGFGTKVTSKDRWAPSGEGLWKTVDPQAEEYLKLFRECVQNTLDLARKRNAKGLSL